jgi:hypothetical protein
MVHVSLLFGRSLQNSALLPCSVEKCACQLLPQCKAMLDGRLPVPHCEGEDIAAHFHDILAISFGSQTRHTSQAKMGSCRFQNRFSPCRNLRDPRNMDENSSAAWPFLGDPSTSDWEILCCSAFFWEIPGKSSAACNSHSATMVKI